MAKISSITVEKVQNFADIVAIASEYMRLENRNGDFWGCCPFHNEKTPSFHIIPGRNFFHCFGCGKSGSAITFLMEIEKLSFPEAIETIAKKSGIEIIYEQGEKSDSHLTEKNTIIDVYKRLSGTFNYFLTSDAMGKYAKEYTETRGISPEMIEKFKLGFSHPDRFWLKKFLKSKNYSDDFLSKTGLFSKKNPDAAFFSNRLMFPICDRNGAVVAFGARILPPNDGPKYINSAETEIYKKGSTVYAFHLAKPEILRTKTVILCEGYMDVIAFHQAGISNAVAPLGTALTENQVKMLRSFADTAILCFDTDEAGLQACFKSILLCRKENFEVKITDFSRKFGKNEQIPKDPAEILLNFGPMYLTQIINSAIIDSEFLLTSFLEHKSYDVSTAGGRAKASLLFFDYVDSIPSQIQQEAALEE
ncbi:MAG: DNA primase, partial [Spirochaetaceae bacterium]|nr:DNA primase [Spirochaetaceae bacterium]